MDAFVAGSRGYGQYGVLIETSAGARPVAVVDRGDVEAKRQANIAKKERDRKEREKNRRKSAVEMDEERRAHVQAKAAERQEKIKKTEQKRALRQAADDEAEKVQSPFPSVIVCWLPHARCSARQNKPRSKYKRSEIMTLKELFDE